jgi:hypothetical protein
VKVFLSYSVEDKKIAGQIKRFLERFEMEVFLAHEDIEPSREWEEVIIEQLKACDVFIPILTENFVSSQWTDQETGFALSRQIPIIPINVGVKPYGFISKYQAFPFDENDIYKSCVGIMKIISKKLALGKEFTNALIKVFGNSDSFDNAAKNSGLLLEFLQLFTIQQKNRILKIAASNEQIYYSFTARANLEKFIRICKNDLKKPLVKILEKKMSLSLT